MADIKFNYKKLKGNLTKKLNEFTKNTKELKNSARIIEKEIKANSRNGEGYDGKDFPGLRDSTIDARERLEESNQTHIDYRSGESNITFTGETVDSIDAKASSNKIIISAKGNHSLLMGKRGKPLKGSNASFRDIITGLEDKGWKIIGVSREAKTQITNQFRRFIRRNL